METKNKINKIFLFLIIFIIINNILYLNDVIINRYNIQNTHMEINNFYSLETDEHFDSDVYLNIIEKKSENSTCLLVEKLQNENNQYIMGNIKSNIVGLGCKKLDKDYSGYFYINYLNDEDEKFNLTKKELEKKFSKKIRFEKAKTYLNKYGSGGTNLTKIIILINFVKAFFLTIIVFIMLLPRKK